MRPVVAVTMPQMMLISVVLPAPLGPRSAKISPLRISRLTGCSACTPDAYDFVTFSIEMMGGIFILFSQKRSLAVRDPLDQGGGEFGGGCLAADVARPDLIRIEGLAEGGSQSQRHFRQSAMVEHHGGGEQERGWIGDAFA